MRVLSIGTDPEAFLEKDGKIVSAIGKIGGTKKDPMPIKGMKGFFLQEDNVLLEYNTPPAKTASSWLDANHSIREYLTGWLKAKGLEMSEKASHSMDPEEMNHPKAFVIGCDPDYDVWEKKWNRKPVHPDPLMRAAGGHLHVALSDTNLVDVHLIARSLDYWVGAPLAALDPDQERKKFYGRPGAIRFKPYGLEYRTPSNFWTTSSIMTDAVFRNIHEAVGRLALYERYEEEYLSAKAYLEGKRSDFNTYLFTKYGAPYA